MCHFDIVLASLLCSRIIPLLDLFILSHNTCILRTLYSALLLLYTQNVILINFLHLYILASSFIELLATLARHGLTM